MADEDNDSGVKPIWLIIIGALVWWNYSDGGGVSPEPGPGPVDPDAPDTALVEQVRVATEGMPAETVDRFGALYWAMAQYLDESQLSVDDARAGLEKTKDAMHLTSTDTYKDFLRKYFDPYAEGEIDRKEYAGAIRALGEACEQAAKK